MAKVTIVGYQMISRSRFCFVMHRINKLHPPYQTDSEDSVENSRRAHPSNYVRGQATQFLDETAEVEATMPRDPGLAGNVLGLLDVDLTLIDDPAQRQLVQAGQELENSRGAMQFNPNAVQFLWSGGEDQAQLCMSALETIVTNYNAWQDHKNH